MPSCSRGLSVNRNAEAKAEALAQPTINRTAATAVKASSSVSKSF